MNIFDDINLDSPAEDFELESGFYENPDSTSTDSIMESTSQPFTIVDLHEIQSSELTVTGDISFEGHLEDIYKPSINQAKDDFNYHISKAEKSSVLSDLNYHLDKAMESRRSEEFFQECLAEAKREQAIHEAFLESITKPTEIADAYQREIESILNPNASNVSFGSNMGNIYDRNALEFLTECQKHDIDLPGSVDYSSLKSETVVDRSVDGGFRSVDKAIIKSTLDKYHNNGELSDDDYSKLVGKLYRC